MSSCEELKILLQHAPYAFEINNYWKSKEVERCPYYSRSPQLQYRLYLIEHIRFVSRHLKLSMITVHLAVHLLDYLMDNYNNIKLDKLNLVVLGCISLSAKYEGQNGFTPKISQLNKFVVTGYPENEFITIELKILKFFNMNLSMPTTAHFMEIYRWLSVLQQDCLDNKTSNLRQNAFSTITDLLDIMLDDHKINMFKPSLIAACCVFITRQLLKLTPKWPAVLQTITGYNADHLNTCYNFLMSLYKKHYSDEEINNDSDSGEDSEDEGIELFENNDDTNDYSGEDNTDCECHSHASCTTNSSNERN